MLGVKLLVLMRHGAKAELKMFFLLQCLEAVQSKCWAKPKFKNKIKKKNRKKIKTPVFLNPKNSTAAAFKFLDSVNS